ncbi:cobaltochelatase subunit CobS [Alphaproteobacteria bacterium]|nr:cobaltochelatase subunit CobS [Alphaproteobacteria bacterium]
MEEPDIQTAARDVFGLHSDLVVPAYSAASELTPVRDPDYVFDPDATLAILAGLAYNRRVLVQGLHGTGKSSHIEQVAAWLNWPCIRINLDGQISRFDLIGKDVITLIDGHQITEFREGILPFAMQQPCILILDEYDAGRPDVMFVIQRVLEVDGKLTLLDQNRVIHPSPWFRLFATSNTVGQGDETGLYYGTQQLNQSQLDRWHMVLKMDYVPPAREFSIVRPKAAESIKDKDLELMIGTAGLMRRAFADGRLSITMSPRTVIAWAQNAAIFGDIGYAFRLSFLNRAESAEAAEIAALFQEGMGYGL